MTSFQHYQGDPQGCQYERLDHAHKPYMCNNPVVWVWTPEPTITVLLCPTCANWLKTMASLGLKV